MADYRVPPSARRVQFEEPQGEACVASSGADPLPSTPVRLRDAGSFAPEPEDTRSLFSPDLKVKCAGCDANTTSVAPKPGSRSSLCDNVNASLVRNSCVDPADICDNRCFTELRDDFNPSRALSLDSKDSICCEINLTSECRSTSDGHTQSIAPKVEGKKEMRGDDPISTNTRKTADGKCSPCVNPGNPVFSCMEKIMTSPHPPTPFVKLQNPLYRTTSADYGSNNPTCDIAPSVYKPLSQSFSEVLCTTGMYRNRSLNTGLDKKRVHDLLQM
ncbi:uncharacterized protein LOC132382330 [Hypanus sabinus]|uniref:uncharacterized protein LOC132382330 n=1 Tax=Hypanus sabinus TaxID=79690 RepID=UPI0028C490C1|nr:uncharacterized protein LOC132382330 [Hypanus sabinus]